VFTDLSRNAGRLKSETVLTAWLYQVARRTAVDVVRRESRRQLREQIAVELTDMNTNLRSGAKSKPLVEERWKVWRQPSAARFSCAFSKNRSLREVGETLGTSEDAAQKRVSRAVERLREFFTKRGVTAGAGSVAAALSANGRAIGSTGMGTAISTAAVSGAALHSATTIAATKTIAMDDNPKSL